MPITINCAGCLQTLRLKDEQAGKRVKCPKCGQIVAVPSLAPDTPLKVAATVSRPAPSTVPRVASQVGSLVATITLFDSESRWSVLGRQHSLPFAWFRRLLFDTFGWVGLGMTVDDALAYIVQGPKAPQSNQPVKTEVELPDDRAEAIQTAAAAGFLTSPIESCLELKRFQVTYRNFAQASLRGILLSPMIAVAIFLICIYVVLPIWGLKRLCKILPDGFRRRIARWYTGPSLLPRLFSFPFLWGLGLFAGAFHGVLFIYSIFWPPLFLKLLSRTGDLILVTKDSVIIHSASYQIAAQAPKNWPVIQGRLGRYFVILGDATNWAGRVCSVCVIQLPPGWAEEHKLRVESCRWSMRRHLLDKAGELRKQVQ